MSLLVCMCGTKWPANDAGRTEYEQCMLEHVAALMPRRGQDAAVAAAREKLAATASLTQAIETYLRERIKA